MPKRGTRPGDNGLRDLVLPYGIVTEDSCYNILEQWYRREAEPSDQDNLVLANPAQEAQAEEGDNDEGNEKDGASDRSTELNDTESHSFSSCGSGSASQSDNDSDGGNPPSQSGGHGKTREAGMESPTRSHSTIVSITIDLTGDDGDDDENDDSSAADSQSRASGTPVQSNGTRESQRRPNTLGTGRLNPSGRTTSRTPIGLGEHYCDWAANATNDLVSVAIQGLATSNTTQRVGAESHERGPATAGFDSSLALSGRPTQASPFVREPSGASRTSGSELFVSGFRPLERSIRTSPSGSVAGSTRAPSLTLSNIPEINDRTEAAYMYSMRPPPRPWKHFSEESSDGEEAPFKRQRRG
ncbi:hypothetical protein SODALDRAFT_374825 [Sodiomyces alkalinus F11]|uniref:Uncharacterized protein n=1 Tax=Sodiomyces alkalinus (strain CBS 110278 / VKM F-3762 / F11) TaxID=1314773 RepID=A0A3N2Q6U6_SODAK|nr:hypothetical protein SODALDRAFT_374825 [Sodiomyces alkalinus F11]ROT42501.1 hypothetical protein SODALDRAFT_374825 [Sodiomyces alkalinus F11]